MSEIETKPLPVPKNPKSVQQAIVKGQEIIASGGSKADAARAMYEIIQGEEREVVVLAFIQGANLTPKGAPTYFYNVVRQQKKAARKHTKKTV